MRSIFVRNIFLMLSFALSSALLFVACDNSVGVFASIQQEARPKANSKFALASVQGFASFNGRYFALTNSLWTRSISGGDWSETLPVSYGTDGSETRVNSVAASNSAIYAIVAQRDTFKGIYKSTDGDNWTDTTVDNSLAPQALYVANNELFVLSTSGGVWVLSHFNTATGKYVNVQGLSITGAWPVETVLFDGAQYWVLTGDKIFASSSAETGFTQKTWSLTTDVNNLTARIYGAAVGTDGFYVVAKNNSDLPGVYSYTRSTGTWSTLYGRISSDSAFARGTRAIAEVPATATSTLLALGNASGGYYEGTSSGSDSTALLSGQSATNYNTTIKTFPVNLFYYDAVNKKLFAGISALTTLNNSSSTIPSNTSALYRNDWNGQSWSGWIAE